MRAKAVLLLLLTLAAHGCGSASTPAPIIVGNIVDLSGPGKKVGERTQLGMRVALEEMNKDTSLRPIVVRHADTLGKLDAYEAQAVRLITLSKAVALMGGLTS